jgi:hypothetical protein
VNDEDPDRDAILARRRRLVALALTGLTTAAPGCYESHERAGDGGAIVDARTADVGAPRPCLSDSGGPMPCLGTPLEDAGEPMPCLSQKPPDDGGSPMPCLDVKPDDAGQDAAPAPCLFAQSERDDDGEDQA